MKAEVYEIIHSHLTNYQNKVYKTFTIEAETEDKLFRKFYAEERGLRYCNDRWLEFVEGSMNEKYREWKEKNETISMYYGSATVD